MAPERRDPVQTPGPADVTFQENDDFTLCASLYYDAVFFYAQAEQAEQKQLGYAAGRFKRAAVLAALTFFEAQMNQAAFGHAAAHRAELPTFELDVLEEKETSLAPSGKIERKGKFYRSESRFRFLAMLLSGKEFDCSGQVWQNFRNAQELRDRWVHPKPPFDTWGLSLTDVIEAITAVRDVYVELSLMMGVDPPLWPRPFEDVLADARSDPNRP